MSVFDACLWLAVLLLSMQDQKALRFRQKYLNLSSENEQRSYSFGTTWGWVINDRIFIFGWTIPWKRLKPRYTSNEVHFEFVSAVRNSSPKQTFWGSSFWLLNTFELPLVRGDYAISGCVLELQLLWRAFFFFGLFLIQLRSGRRTTSPSH